MDGHNCWDVSQALHGSLAGCRVLITSFYFTSTQEKGFVSGNMQLLWSRSVSKRPGSEFMPKEGEPEIPAGRLKALHSKPDRREPNETVR